MSSYDSTHMLPPPPGTSHYNVVSTNFTDSVSPQEIRLNLPDEFTGLERILLQTTGNLQRVLSAYFNNPVQVQHIKNVALPDTPSLGPIMPDTPPSSDDDAPTVLKRFDRQINMYCEKKFLYKADSVLIVQDKAVLDMIEKDKAGIGQIFWALQKVPTFKLHTIGRHGDQLGGSFWRDYSLSVKDVFYCYIREMFPVGLFNSNNLSTDDAGTHDMEPCVTGTVWIAN